MNLFEVIRRMAGYFEDFNWVQPQIAVGGRIHPGVAKRLARQFGIRHVVDLRSEEVDDVELLRNHGVRHLHLPTPDTYAVLSDHLWEGVHWVRQALNTEGEKVLIHCEYGMGRSVLLAACVLVSQGLSPVDALKTIRQGRKVASPTRVQLTALLSWSGEWCKKESLAEPCQSLYDLERVIRGHVMPDLFGE